MKKKDLKNIVVPVLLGIVIVISLFVLIKLGGSDEDLYNKCLEKYSVNYCKKSVYGIY